MGCADGSDIARPIPWIGVYVAAASGACTLAMAADVFFGLRRRILWFPSRFFSINATSLVLLGIATKLPVDLNTSMPRWQDQLAKLSGTVRICAAMVNFMPSLGSMSDSEMAMNVVALCILVVTVVVNVGIQMGTGVIFVFWPEHAIVMFLMLFTLGILVSSALIVSTTKQLLEEQYGKKHQQALVESSENHVVEKLKEEIKKYWMMAHTCNPQYVLGRSAMCSASAILYLLSSLVLLEAWLRKHVTKSVRFCSGESDYKWSIKMVLLSQVIAIGVAGIAPVCRWLNAARFGGRVGGMWSYKNELRVETYWTVRLERWKERPLPYQISNRRLRRIAHLVQSRLLDVCIGAQSTIVLTSKFLKFLSRLPLCWVRIFMHSSAFITLLSKGPQSASDCRLQAHLSEFVLHLEGEEDLVQMIMEHGFECTNQWIHTGRKNQPKHLVELLRTATVSKGFRGVAGFDSEVIPSIADEEAPNCWALPLVTLTSIAMALPGADQNTIKLLRYGVDEGLRYVRLVERNLDAKGLTNVRDAADIVWLGIDLYNRWLDKELHRATSENKIAREVIEELADEGKRLVSEYVNGSGAGTKTNPLEWPSQVLAANSMYRVGQTILQLQGNKLGRLDDLVHWIKATIADILAACFTNLPRVISKEYRCSTIEVREANVGHAARLLGETESILEIVGFAGLNLDSLADIENWRLSNQNHYP